MSIPASRISQTLLAKLRCQPRGGMRGMLDAATALADTGRDAVCAILVSTSGTVHRERGAMALFDEEGLRAGSLGGGELERKLWLSSRDVLANGKADLLNVDAQEDSSYSSSKIADDHGSMQILLLPMRARGSALRDAMLAACSDSAWLRLRLELGRGQEGQSDLGFGEARTGNHMFAFDRRGDACPGPIEFVRHVSLGFAPPPRIALFGVGPESRVLASIARLLGWYVEAVDAGPDIEQHLEGDSVDRVHDISPEEMPELLAERHYDAAVIGGHDFDTDARHLRQLGATGIGYVGLLGPPERRDALLGKLGDIIATQLEPRLYAPVGLRLGGGGPEVTALAIAAQLQYYLSHDMHA